MKSWRLKFIDIDDSLDMQTSIATITGYITVRSPKGNTKPTYFGPSQTKSIEAMIGIPSAHYSDIGEAIAFNREFGIYISAPPGTSADYPSYFGGIYITKHGVFPFYEVSDKDAPNWSTPVELGSEKLFNPSYASSETELTELSQVSTSLTKQGTFKVEGISNGLYSNLSKFTLDFWGSPFNNTPAGKIDLIVDNGKIKVITANGPSEKSIGTVAQESDGTWSFNFGEGYGDVISATDVGIPYFTFNGIADINQLLQADGVTPKPGTDVGTPGTKAAFTATYTNTTSDPIILSSDLTFSNSGIVYTAINTPAEISGDSLITVELQAAVEGIDPNPIIAGSSSSGIADVEMEILNFVQGTNATPGNLIEEIKDLILEGGTKELGDTLKIPFQSIVGIRQRFKWIVSVRNDTYMYVVQKTPTEKTTLITINNIGYDKYHYDLGLDYVINQEVKFDDKVANKIYEAPTPPIWYPQDADGLFIAFKEEGVPTTGTKFLETGIYKKEGSQFTRFTDEQLTKYVRIIGPAVGSGAPEAYEDTLMFVGRDSTNKISLLEVGFDKAIQPANNNLFNTFNISVAEEVYPGTLTSGGEFLGSLSEGGRDTFGGNIYWPEVLPDDAMSFIEVVPVKTFDEEDDSSLNSKGFFTGTRIVDLKGPAPDISVSYIKGYRYISKLTQDNINNKIVGNTWNDSMGTVISQGWTEAFMPKYDEVFIFMDPTGYDGIKGTLLSLRQVQNLSTVISPKLISQAEFLNPSTIVVESRGTGTAQYVGLFLLKDPYTLKKYWVSPIGDVGLNLARIIDQKLGGWAPMWNNIAGGLGGQLTRSVLEAKYDFDDTAQQVMDQKGINPIVYNASDGLMIVSQKTTLDPNSLSDWSYLAHSMAFDLCKRELRDSVMRPQIGKPIDDFYMDLRERQATAVLEKRTEGSQPIWAGAKATVKEVNNAVTKGQRDFQIKAVVKVNPFSEGVTLTFVNVSQSTVIS